MPRKQAQKTGQEWVKGYRSDGIREGTEHAQKRTCQVTTLTRAGQPASGLSGPGESKHPKMEDETTRATAEGPAETMPLDEISLACIIDRVADKLRDTQSAGSSSNSREAEDRRASAGPSSSGLGKLVNPP